LSVAKGNRTRCSAPGETTMRTLAACFVALFALPALACKEDNRDLHPSTNHEPQPAKPASTPYAGNVDVAAAQALFSERCAVCHGTDGKGDGPASAALNPKPRNYTDTAWQATVSDDALRKTIRLGGAAVGKSPLMPASPDLDDKPEVVEGLVKIVRKFGT
jgi:mono/diheme cytochrome c family protein